MADISKIKALNGVTYNVKDATARKSNMSQSEATTGTATTARYISAKVLTDTITEKAAVKRELTKAEYDALTDAEKNNGTIYLVSDENGGFPIDNEVLQGSSHAVSGGAVYEAINDRVVKISVTLPTSNQFIMYDYPDGFNFSNCVIVNFQVYYSEYGWLSVSNNTTFYPVQREEGAGFYNGDTGYYGRSATFTLLKIA